MIDQSLAHAAHTTTPVERIAARIEAELDRLHATRPGLASRISHAGALLVSHLSCKRQRVIRVRVRDGQARFLIDGSDGAVYVVDPSSWSCSCPDHHRRGMACKHSIACWALAKAAPSSTTSCSSCGTTSPKRDLVELTDENHDDLAGRNGDRLCRPCADRMAVSF